MSWLGSDAIRMVAYGLVAALILLARWRERRLVGGGAGVWPAFWTMTFVFLLAIGIGEVAEASDFLSSLGRDAANEGGWYAARRPFQAAVVGAIGGVWLVVVTVAMWRTPDRRRRYLPVGLKVVTLGAYAAIRLVSLHQVDALLYRTRVSDVQVGTLVELALLGLTGLATLWSPPARTGVADGREVGPEAAVSRDADGRA